MPLARALRLLPPETAHTLALKGVRWAAAWSPTAKPAADPELETNLAGLHLAHPIGLAAGFDKNAVAASALFRLGFALVEVGTVTLHPQTGNPRPRIFRLSEDRAIINRLGFNNAGLEAAKSNLMHAAQRSGPLGINIGINKTTTTPLDDYSKVLSELAPWVDYATINVSSPNTPGLRTWQHGDQLKALLQRVAEVRDETRAELPLFLKLAPDLARDDEPLIVETALECGIQGLIVSNTTLSRPSSLCSRNRTEAGGLSGAPLFEPSTAQLRRMARHAKGRLALIGVGGVFSGADAYAKIRAGAAAVQLYTALIYRGPGAINAILSELKACLESDGFKTVGEAIGADLSMS
ncbi:MAG: quinone-dependent dihydroorotate dehydrogenase [Pseudomonadota bacterium]